MDAPITAVALPNLTFEMDPDGPGALTYHDGVRAGAAERREHLDGDRRERRRRLVDDRRRGHAQRITLASTCTLAEIKASPAAAKMKFSFAISKGATRPFRGAIDRL